MDSAAVGLQAHQDALRVFLAEDSGNVVDSLADLIAVTRAHVVGVARTEAEALDWAGAHTVGWDVAIVDLILDQGSGFNVIRRLKSHNPAGQVVVFSGYVSDVIRAHCRTLGADLVLGKDENERLAAYVEDLIARRAAAR